jgi:predicted NUDIX family NTP pyrophosphohydrolase
MKRQSAGLLLFRKTDQIEVLLVHPGGPFWAKKEMGSWSIPKGEFLDDEEPQTAARREFYEELGVAAPEGELIGLGSAKQSSGKVVYAWALEADFDTKHVKSNVFEMEWPPKSGQMQQFPEVDRAAWFDLPTAAQKVVKGQVPLLKNLTDILGTSIDESSTGDNQTTLL